MIRTTDEGDRLDPLPLPRENLVLFEREEAERTWLDAFRSGRMPHAWQISGARGSGKATLAFRMARFLAVSPAASETMSATDLAVPEDHPAVGRIAASSHPDVLHVARPFEKGKRAAALSVEAVRGVGSFLSLTSGEGGWRTVIVDTADDMNRNAANAILKMLEEPPARTVFLLLSDSPGRLLPTIRSRCRPLRLKPLGAPAIRRALEHFAVPGSEDEHARAAAVADGSLRRAVTFLLANRQEMYERMIAAFSGDREAAHALAGLVSAPDDLRAFLELFQGYVHRRVRGLSEPASAGPTPDLPLVTWSALWEKATALAGQTLEFNLDRPQVILELFDEVHGAPVA